MKADEVHFADLSAGEAEKLKRFEQEFLRETGKSICLLAVEKKS